MGHERCDLCGAPAAVHCAADAAFLCAPCDAKVHAANFLASRHRRTRLRADHAYESATSSCVSTADSASTTPAPARGRRARAEAVLEGWAERMGIPPGAERRRAVRACGPGVVVAAARVPLRVAMAAALWREVAAEGGGGRGRGDALRRLEACAHVPARLVVAVASSLPSAARVRRRPGVGDAAEGGGGRGRGDALRRLEACAHVPARFVVAVASSLPSAARVRRRPGVGDAAEGWDECSWTGPESNPTRS